jgi:hypothetical protein
MMTMEEVANEARLMEAFERVAANDGAPRPDRQSIEAVRGHLPKVAAAEEGVPQGGPLSPLLSNIVLDELDRELERRGHRFVRYADELGSGRVCSEPISQLGGLRSPTRPWLGQDFFRVELTTVIEAPFRNDPHGLLGFNSQRIGQHAAFGVIDPHPV